MHRRAPRTLSEKVWDRHVVHTGTDDEPDIIFIDLHLVHEVTSPQAFDGLRLAGRGVHRPDLTIATADHNVPTARHRQAGGRSHLGQAARGAGGQLQPSSGSPATPWATPTRASSTSSVPSRASPNRA